MIIIGIEVHKDWIKELFIEKAHLFLRLLNAMWRTSEEESMYVAKLLSTLGLGKESKILDLGCGNGRIAINLAKHGYKVVGVDISPILIEDALKKAKEHKVTDRVKFLVGDALKIPEVLRDEVFDATIMYWTTIIGYYLSKDIDIEILRNIKKVTKDQGYLLILNTVSLDLVALRSSLCRVEGVVNEIDEEYMLIEKPRFDPKTSIVENTWLFYRKEGKNLKYIDEISFRLKVYTLHELVEIAEKAGWRFVNAYQDLVTLRPYKPGLSSLNVVFKNI